MKLINAIMKRLLCLCATLLTFATSGFSQTQTDTIRLEVKPTEGTNVLYYDFTEDALSHVELEWVLGEGDTGKFRPADSGWTNIRHTIEDTGWIYIYYNHEQQETYSLRMHVYEGSGREPEENGYDLNVYSKCSASLDVSGCTALTSLSCSNNQLTSLDVSGCTALMSLDCYKNQLTSLDVSGCTALTSLYCGGNQLTSLDVSGCTALMSLDCYRNQLTSLDVSGCTALTSLLSCSNNQLTSLDVSGCTALTGLSCSNNQLTSLDISNNTALTSLDCSNNQLTSLDISNNTALTSLDCSNNQLTSLDVSGCTALTDLYCYDNDLRSLDVSGCTALTSLSCSNNRLTALDISNNTALTSLDCSNNRLTALDISNNTAMTSLDCYQNRLPLSTLYEIYTQISKWSDFWCGSQSDSIMILIDQPFDLSTERIIGQTLSTYELTDAYGREVDADFWTENKFEFCFHEPLKYTLKLQNVNIKKSGSYGPPVTFIWYISVVEEMPVQYYTVKVASNHSAWGTATLTGNGRYEEGSNVTITAKAKEGYRFVNWTKKDGSVFSTEAVHTFTATENLDLTANFEERPNDVETFTVAISANNAEGGRASLSGDGT